MSHVHTNIGIFINVMPGARRFRIVTTMLIPPMIDDAPIRWIAKMARSMPGPICVDSGGIQRPAGGGRTARHEERRDQQRGGNRPATRS